VTFGVVQHSIVVESILALVGGYTISCEGRHIGPHEGGVLAPCLRALGTAAQQQVGHAGVGQQHMVTHGDRGGQ